MANRPGFINTAAQRKRDGTGFEPIDLLPRYVDAYAGRFKWTGLPELHRPDHRKGHLHRYLNSTLPYCL